MMVLKEGVIVRKEGRKEGVVMLCGILMSLCAAGLVEMERSVCGDADQTPILIPMLDSESYHYSYTYIIF